MNRSIAYARHPHRLNGEAANSFGLKRQGDETEHRYVPKEQCGGKCSLNTCKTAMLTGMYSAGIKQYISQSDVDAHMFAIGRSHSKAALASDCATYKIKTETCHCQKPAD